MSDLGYTAETAPAAFRGAYKALEPDPNADYGSLLPFARDRATGEKRLAMPSMVRDLLGGWLDLLAGVDSGEVTPRAAMDEVSRLARARDLGFQMDRPLYHGTLAPDFPAFRVLPPWEAVRLGQPPGIWAAENPQVAGRFAEPGARPLLGLSPTSQRQQLQQDQARILPLFARSENAGPLTLRPGDDWRDVWRTIAGAFDAGRDAVQLRNYTNFPDLGPQTIWTFRDPAQLRSQFAAFDPAKKDSPDLMAGFAVPGPAPTPGFRVRADAEPSGLNAFRRMMDEERVY